MVVSYGFNIRCVTRVRKEFNIMLRRLTAVFTVLVATLVVTTTSALAGTPIMPVPKPTNVNVTYGQYKTPDGPLVSQTYVYGSNGQYTRSVSDASIVKINVAGHSYVRVHFVNLPKETVSYTNVYYSNPSGFGFNRQDWNGKTLLPTTIRIVVDRRPINLTLAFASVGLYNPARPLPSLKDCSLVSCGK